MEILKRDLIIYDEKNIYLALKNLYNEKGYETETAMTGEEALDRISERFFNVALIDINLPDIEGIDLVESFRKKK